MCICGEGCRIDSWSDTALLMVVVFDLRWDNWGEKQVALEPGMGGCCVWLETGQGPSTHVEIASYLQLLMWA